MIEASYHKGQMKVEFDEKLVSIHQIKAEVQRLGYQAVDQV
jgi:copper chaperone CopZ